LRDYLKIFQSIRNNSDFEPEESFLTKPPILTELFKPGKQTELIKECEGNVLKFLSENINAFMNDKKREGFIQLCIKCSDFKDILTTSVDTLRGNLSFFSID